jgi:Ca-activated chloride channel family protein
MTFDRVWVLFFLILPIGWVVWEWTRQARKSPLLLKAGVAIAVTLALSGPTLNIRDRKVALAVMVDTSASISDADLAKENKLLGDLNGARGSNEVDLIPFARTTRGLTPNENETKIERTGGSAGRGTNLEAPIRQALAALPSGMVHRMIMVTDGNENEGAVTRVAWQAQQLGIPIDTIALAGREQPKLKTEAVGIPSAVFTGERFPVDLTIISPSATNATVELSAEGKTIGSHPVKLAAGENRIRIRTSLNAAGAVDISGKIAAAGLGESRFENAITVRRPKVTWISDDPIGSEGHMAELLAANKFDVTQAKSVPASLDDTQILVLNNENLETMRPADKQRATDFAQSGGGLLMIAGEKNVYIDHKDQPEDALALAFPAKLVPPRSPQGTAVVLIIDKSSSMEGKKIELARAAAAGVVDNLKPDDRVGILIFDNSFMWDVPIRAANDKALIKREISQIQPDGGTQIAPALNEAYRRIVTVNAAYKHIVLLTDGISEEGDSVGLAKEAANNRVTISTVGLGQDVNRVYLEKIANGAKGRSYLLNEPTGLEQILLKDVQEHTGTTAVEKPIKAEVKHQSDLLDKVDMATSPNLAGYVRFETRPTADEILAVDTVDPLLTRWQYGLGRTAVFASDAKSRWAAEWLNWPGFDRLWTNIFRDLLPHGNESEAVARYDNANEELVVDYQLSPKASDAVTVPDLFVLGPADFKRALDVVRVSPSTYRGRVRIGSLEGLFRIRPLNDSRAFPEIGLYRQEAELSDYGSNEALLKSIAASTGGRFNPKPSELFDSGGKYTDSTLRLWPGLLALAIILNLVELLLRKWKGILESLKLRRDPVPA